MIMEYELIENGFQESDFPIYLYEKNISEPDEDGGRLAIIITMERNIAEFALVMPDGNKLFLNIEDMDDIKTLERLIQSWEPNY